MSDPKPTYKTVESFNQLRKQSCPTGIKIGVVVLQLLRTGRAAPAELVGTWGTLRDERQRTSQTYKVVVPFRTL